MKVFTYSSGAQRGCPPGSSGEVLPDALLQGLFRSESLDEALAELQREGAVGTNGEICFKGMQQLLDEIQSQWESVLAGHLDPAAGQDAAQELVALIETLPYAAGSSGPVRSGPPQGTVSAQAVARFLLEKSLKGESLSFQQAAGAADELLKLHHLQKTMRRARWGYDLNSIDEGSLHKVLGPAGRGTWQRIRDLPEALVRQGLAEQRNGRMLLTSRGLQKVARGVLQEIFKPRRKDARPPRVSADLNTEPYLVQGTRPYRFGDPLQVDAARSLLNALRRSGRTASLQLVEEDFEVFEKEPIRRTATVVLLDLSKSMRFEQRYVAAKKVALALYALVRGRYPQDRIGVVAFSSEARRVTRGELPFLTWDGSNPYTNMEDAFRAGHRVLSAYKGYRRQVFLVTDGEPTAHRHKGALFFQFPPHPATLKQTQAALARLTRQNISLSIFLLSQEKDSVSFMHVMARKSGGRVFHLHPADLGRCLLMDYMDRKRKWI